MKAPERIPSEHFNGYIMDGGAILEYNYANDCSDEIQKQFNDNFKPEIFKQYLEKAARRENFYYGPTDLWLYEALAKYPIEGKDIRIIGSANPWYEAIAISFGELDTIGVKVLFRYNRYQIGALLDLCLNKSLAYLFI